MQAQQPPPSDKDGGVLLKLEQDWANAVAKHDAAFIERVEDDAYVYTDAFRQRRAQGRRPRHRTGGRREDRFAFKLAA